MSELVGCTELQALSDRGHNWEAEQWQWDAQGFKAEPAGEPVASSTSGSGRASKEADTTTGSGHQSGSVDAGRAKGRRPARGKRRQATGSCQADDCSADLSNSSWHERKRICPQHAQAKEFLKKARPSRFCQQCSRVHLIEAFEKDRRSCKEQLAKHAARRRARNTTGKKAGKGEAGRGAAAAAAAEGGDSSSGEGNQQTTSPLRPAQLQLTGHAALTGPPMAAPAAEQLLGSMGQQLHQRLDRQEQAADLAMLRSILFSSIGPEVAPSSSSSHTELLPEHQLRLLSRSVHPSPFRHEAAPVRLPTGGSATDSASGSAATTAAQRMDEWMDATQLMTMNVPLGEPLYSAVGDAEALQGLLPGPGPLARDSLALPTRQSDSSLPARGSGTSQSLSQDEPGEAAAASQQPQLQQRLPGTVGHPTGQALGPSHQQQQPLQPQLVMAAMTAAGQAAGPSHQQQLPGQQQGQERQTQAAQDQLLGLLQGQRLQGQLLQQQQQEGLQQQMGGLAASQGQQQSAAAAHPSEGALETALHLYHAMNVVHRLSLKLFNCTPDQLPAGMRETLTGWLHHSPAFVEGYMRPGCVQITMQATLDARQQGQLPAIEQVVEHLLRPEQEGHDLWHGKTMLLQCGPAAALITHGRLLRVFQQQQGTAVPAACCGPATAGQHAEQSSRSSAWETDSELTDLSDLADLELTDSLSSGSSSIKRAGAACCDSAGLYDASELRARGGTGVSMTGNEHQCNTAAGGLILNCLDDAAAATARGCSMADANSAPEHPPQQAVLKASHPMPCYSALQGRSMAEASRSAASPPSHTVATPAAKQQTAGCRPAAANTPKVPDQSAAFRAVLSCCPQPLRLPRIFATEPQVLEPCSQGITINLRGHGIAHGKSTLVARSQGRHIPVTVLAKQPVDSGQDTDVLQVRLPCVLPPGLLFFEVQLGALLGQEHPLLVLPASVSRGEVEALLGGLVPSSRQAFIVDLGSVLQWAQELHSSLSRQAAPVAAKTHSEEQTEGTPPVRMPASLAAAAQYIFRLAVGAQALQLAMCMSVLLQLAGVFPVMLAVGKHQDDIVELVSSTPECEDQHLPALISGSLTGGSSAPGSCTSLARVSCNSLARVSCNSLARVSCNSLARCTGQ